MPTQTLTPGRFDNSNSFYAANIKKRLKPALFTNSNTLYAPQVFKERIGYLNSQFSLPLGYIGQYGYLNSAFGLDAFSKKQGYLSSQFNLPVFVKEQGYVDAQFALNVWQLKRGFLDSQFALNAYQVAQGYLDSEFLLDATEAYACFVANLRTGAHSTYSNFNFNSLSGEYGAKDDGIYQLTGTTDGGVAIATLLDTGKTDFQSAQLKRMTDAYLGVKSDGSIKLNLITENTDTTYTIAATNALQTHKINLGRGAIGRYWQAILENVSGSSFVLESLELNTEILSRKVRGGAAQVTVVNPVPELGLCCNDIEMPFSWGDATPAVIVVVPAGKTVFKVQVVLQNVFNGAAVGLTIGDSADNDRLLAAEHISLFDLATYETNPNYLYVTQTEVYLYISVDGSNTQGNGVVLMELKD
jgi:hypothetical protein